MGLFPTRKPRGFRYVYRYRRSRNMDFHRQVRAKRGSNMLLLVILLVLLLAFWLYI